MNLIFINVETFVLQFIILVIVLYVLNKYIFKPYLAYLDEESIRQEKLLQDYNNIDSLLREAEEKKESMLEEARNSAKSIIEEAEWLAKKKWNDIIEKSELDAKNLIKSAESQIEKDRLSMMGQIKSSVVDLIIKFNTKLFKDAKVSKDFVEKELELIK